MTAASGQEVPSVFDKKMFAKGINGDFYNKFNLQPEELLTKFKGRFEGESRDIARASNKIVDLLIEQCGLSAGKMVVDCGAGTGLFMESLTTIVGQTGLVLLTEVSEVFSEHLKNRILVERRDNARVIYSSDPRDPKLLSWAGRADIVIIIDVYHHLEYPRTAMSKLRDVLKPDGRLLMLDFIRDKTVNKSHPENPDWILQVGNLITKNLGKNAI